MPLFDEDPEVLLKGPLGVHANVNEAGQLSTTSEGGIPDGFELVVRSLDGDLAGVVIEDDEYLIPDGKKLLVTRFACTAYASASGDKATKFEIYLDELGTGVSMTLLRAAVCSNSAEEFTSAGGSLTGDGIAKIRMRRESLDSQTRYAPCVWTGWVEQ